MAIGGNTHAVLQRKSGNSINTIGERETQWEDVVGLVGWLDLESGDSRRTAFASKLQESTHLFLCGYNANAAALSPEETRLMAKGKIYEALIIDNPMELNSQLEIYLKYVGGSDG